MNKSLEKIRDIKSLINEVYDDRKCQGELTEGARKSCLCFKQYCDDIKQDLERLEKLEKAIEILKPILDIYAGEGKGYIDCCVENPIITFDLHNDKELKEFYLLKEVLE